MLIKTCQTESNASWKSVETPRGVRSSQTWGQHRIIPPHQFTGCIRQKYGSHWCDRWHRWALKQIAFYIHIFTFDSEKFLLYILHLSHCSMNGDIPIENGTSNRSMKWLTRHFHFVEQNKARKNSIGKIFRSPNQFAKYGNSCKTLDCPDFLFVINFTGGRWVRFERELMRIFMEG